MQAAILGILVTAGAYFATTGILLLSFFALILWDKHIWDKYFESHTTAVLNVDDWVLEPLITFHLMLLTMLTLPLAFSITVVRTFYPPFLSSFDKFNDKLIDKILPAEKPCGPTTANGILD